MDVIAQNAPKMGRRLRRPNHSHNLRSRAFQIQPFMIAPVLAGETLKNLMFQARVVTDPVLNPLVGWWKEYYWFYVKLTDIDFANGLAANGAGDGPDANSLVSMLLNDPNWSWSGSPIVGTADVAVTYEQEDSQNYLTACLGLLVDNYFRDYPDTFASHTLDGLPLAMVNNAGALDSALSALEYEATIIPDEDLLGDASDATLTVSEIDEALRRYQFARANGLTDASYEDYLASFGVQTKVEVPHKPELIRYVRQWQYPSNTVEPTTGVPSSAVSWSIQERADKDRFFREPGFLVGLTCTRPKVYLAGQKGYVSQWLDRAQDWLPTMFGGEALPYWKNYPASEGPFKDLTMSNGYWFDVRDLYLYGDQFVNYALNTTGVNLVALPEGSSTINKKFVDDTDVDSLFVTPATKQWVREDGMTALTIASRQRDMSPTT